MVSPTGGTAKLKTKISVNTTTTSRTSRFMAYSSSKTGREVRVFHLANFYLLSRLVSRTREVVARSTPRTSRFLKPGIRTENQVFVNGIARCARWLWS